MIEDILANKASLRQKMFKLRAELSKSECEENSAIICQRILDSSYIKEYDNFILYYPFQNEVDLLALAEALLKLKKGVYFPRYIKAEKRYDLAKIDSLTTDFKVGKFGIKEPIKEAQSYVEKNTKAIWLIPGVGFDKKGNRLGRGGGYYDRFLSTMKGVFIAVAHGFQLIEEIPTEKHDIKVNTVVTEKSFFTMNT